MGCHSVIGSGFHDRGHSVTCVSNLAFTKWRPAARRREDTYEKDNSGRPLRDYVVGRANEVLPSRCGTTIRSDQGVRETVGIPLHSHYTSNRRTTWSEYRSFEMKFHSVVFVCSYAVASAIWAEKCLFIVRCDAVIIVHVDMIASFAALSLSSSRPWTFDGALTGFKNLPGTHACQ